MAQKTDLISTGCLQRRQRLDQKIWIAQQTTTQRINNDLETQWHGRAYLPAFKALMTLSVMSCLGWM